MFKIYLAGVKKVRRSASFLAIPFILLGALVACQPIAGGTDGSDLSGTSWELSALSGNDLLPGTTITLEFEMEDLSGTAGCNRYSASYQLAQNGLTIGPIAVTEMACPEPQGILEQETAYLTALGAAASFQMTEERLEIMDNSAGLLLVFVSAEAAGVTQPDAPPNAAVVIHNATATSVADATPTELSATVTPVDEVIVDIPPGFQRYVDDVAGVALLLPESWTVTHIAPGQSAIFQSYPADKYVGGEGRDPQDTKCDLTIRPTAVDLAEHLEQVRTDPMITVISETEGFLQSGEPAIYLELDSMGLSRSLVTVIYARVVVLTCFGELAPFDELATSLRASDYP